MFLFQPVPRTTFKVHLLEFSLHYLAITHKGNSYIYRIGSHPRSSISMNYGQLPLLWSTMGTTYLKRMFVYNIDDILEGNFARQGMSMINHWLVIWPIPAVNLHAAASLSKGTFKRNMCLEGFQQRNATKHPFQHPIQ